MREFNSREKDIIKLINKIEIGSTDTFSRVLQEKYFNIQKNRALVVIHTNQDVLLFIAKNDFDDDSRRAKAIGELWELVTLILYLNSERYLSILPITTNSQIDFMYKGFVNLSSTPQNITFTDTDGTISNFYTDRIEKSNGTISFMSVSIKPLYEPIKRNLLGIIYPTEGIKSLVKNKFKSGEEIKFNKQYRLSWAGLLTAIIIGFTGIFYSIYSNKRSNSNSQELSVNLNEWIKNEKGKSEKVIEHLENLNNSFDEFTKKDTLIQNLIETNNAQNKLIIKRLEKFDSEKNN